MKTATRQADRDQDSTDQFSGYGQQQAAAMAHVERVREAGYATAVVTCSFHPVKTSHVESHAEAQGEEPQVDEILFAESCHGRRVAYLSRRPKKSVKHGPLGRRHDPGRVALEPGRVGIEMTTRNVEIKVPWAQNPDTAGGCRCDAISRYRDPQGHC